MSHDCVNLSPIAGSRWCFLYINENNSQIGKQTAMTFLQYTQTSYGVSIPLFEVGRLELL